MPTLYVENVPEDVYEALRARAQGNGKSISAEVLELLAENVPTPAELARRRKVVTRMSKIRSRRVGRGGPFYSTEQMQREDRAR
jgi:plasmid stability protein